VLVDVEPDRLTVIGALRLPQTLLREQFTLIAPHLAGLDLLVDTAAELLPKTPPHVGVCLLAGSWRHYFCSSTERRSFSDFPRCHRGAQRLSF
jgi:hypothetical protein